MPNFCITPNAQFGGTNIWSGASHTNHRIFRQFHSPLPSWGCRGTGRSIICHEIFINGRGINNVRVLWPTLERERESSRSPENCEKWNKSANSELSRVCVCLVFRLFALFRVRAFCAGCSEFVACFGCDWNIFSMGCSFFCIDVHLCEWL